MGSALLEQWSKGPETITVVDPGQESVPGGARLVSDRAALDNERFDCIIVAVKPQMIDDIMPDYVEHLAPDGYVISIAAGYSSARLSATMGDAPVIRVMPNLPAAIGRGVSALCAGAATTSSQQDHAGDLMARAGTAVAVEDEDMLDRATAVAGSGPGYMLEMARAYIASAEKLGFKPEDARKLVLGTMDGSVAFALDREDADLADLRNSVTSKGGTTAAGLEALNGDGKMSRRFDACLGAAYDRAVELR